MQATITTKKDYRDLESLETDLKSQGFVIGYFQRNDRVGTVGYFMFSGQGVGVLSDKRNQLVNKSATLPRGTKVRVEFRADQHLELDA